MPIDGSPRRPRRFAHTVESLKGKTKLHTSTGCWEWQLSLSSHGYGQPSHKGKVYGAHRLMFMLSNPDISIAGKTICHHCDNRKCINPAHLYAGTPLSNMRDMIARGRAKPTGHPGETHPSAKLTAERVRIIRLMLKDGFGYRSLAKIFRVDRTTIRGIAKGRYWKTIE